MDDHITITTKVEEILDVDISQIHSVLNLVFDADIAGSGHNNILIEEALYSFCLD